MYCRRCSSSAGRRASVAATAGPFIASSLALSLTSSLAPSPTSRQEGRAGRVGEHEIDCSARSCAPTRARGAQCRPGTGMRQRCSPRRA